MTPPTFTIEKLGGRRIGFGEKLVQAMHAAEEHGAARLHGVRGPQASVYITAINAWLGEQRFTTKSIDDGVLIRCHITDEAPLVKGGQGRDTESTVFAASLVLACIGIAAAVFAVVLVWAEMGGGA